MQLIIEREKFLDEIKRFENFLGKKEKLKYGSL